MNEGRCYTAINFKLNICDPRPNAEISAVHILEILQLYPVKEPVVNSVKSNVESLTSKNKKVNLLKVKSVTLFSKIYVNMVY